MANTAPGWKWVQVALPTDPDTAPVSSLEFYGTVIAPSSKEAILFILVTTGNNKSIWAYTTAGDSGYYSELLGFPSTDSITMSLGAVIADSAPTLVVKGKDSNVFACSWSDGNWSWRPLATPAVKISMAMGTVPANNVANVLFMDTGEGNEQNLWSYSATSSDWKLSELPPNTLGGKIETFMGTVLANGAPNVLVLNDKKTLWACALPAASSSWKWSQLPRLPSPNTVKIPMGTVLATGTANLLVLDKVNNLWACSQATSGQWQWTQLPPIPYPANSPTNVVPVQLGAAVVNSKPNVFVLNKLDKGQTFLWSCQLGTDGIWQWIQLPSLPDGSNFASPTAEAAEAPAVEASALSSPAGLTAVATDGDKLNFIFLTSSDSSTSDSIESFWYCYNTPG
jgi:hypothetical protein